MPNLKKWNAGAGIILVVFILFHVAGNALLIFGPSIYNGYFDILHALGIFFHPITDVLLIGAVLVHAVGGLSVVVRGEDTGPGQEDAPDSTVGSPVGMLTTGFVLLLFIGIHLLQLRFRTALSGEFAPHTESMFALSWCTFQDPLTMVSYCGVMLALGLHLRHGIWRMLQPSDDADEGRGFDVSRAALLVAVVVAGIFFFLPLGLYFGWIPLAGTAPPTCP